MRDRAALALLAVLSLLVAAVMVPTPAMAAGTRWRTASVASHQEGCRLVVKATYSVDARGNINLDKVLASGLQGFGPALALRDGAGRWVYLGPNAHGRVGDGVDYEWTYGTETNADGVRVPIGASDSNPQGWPHHGYTSRSFEVRVTAPEMRYCGVVLQLPVGG